MGSYFNTLPHIVNRTGYPFPARFGLILVGFAKSCRRDPEANHRRPPISGTLRRLHTSKMSMGVYREEKEEQNFGRQGEPRSAAVLD
jgi:hypothetical protein